MDRRRFVENALGAGMLLASAGPVAASTARMANAAHQTDAAARTTAGDRCSLPEAWGLQLYTVRSLMASDVERTLADIARIGYGEVEFAGYFGRTPAQIRATLDAEGIVAPAAHLSLGELRTDLDAAIAASAEVGYRYLVLPFLEGTERPGNTPGEAPAEVIDGYRRLADELNRIGEACEAEGLRFAYHNHDFELETFEADEDEGPIRPLDVLLMETDPDLVRFEVDFYWVVHGGGDPLDYFWRHPGRFELCHVKDRTVHGEMADVGAGVIDFAGIFERAGQGGLLHYFVEHDNPADPLASVRASYNHLAALGG